MEYFLYFANANLQKEYIDPMEDRYGSGKNTTCSWETSEFESRFQGSYFRICVDYKKKTIYKIIRQINHEHRFYKTRKEGFLNRGEDVKNVYGNYEWKRYQWNVEGDNLILYECSLGSNKICLVHVKKILLVLGKELDRKYLIEINMHTLQIAECDF